MKHPLSDSLEAYKALLSKYHKALDLMSDQALLDIDQKIADSLAYVQALDKISSQPLTVVDIGSGSGLPAVPMALALPHCRFQLVERRQRRATFLTLVKGQLGLKNVMVHAQDVKDVKDVQASAVSALAVGTLEKLYCLSRHLHGETMTLLSRKGEDFYVEVEALEATLGLKVDRVETTPLATHGTLVAVVVAGGVACRLSESSIKRVE